MDTVAECVAELRALTSHIVAMNDEWAKKGFTMASDTRLNLAKAGKLIVKLEGVDEGGKAAGALIAEAQALAGVLRAEAGDRMPLNQAETQ